jgi:hypothetical protein
MKIGLQAWKRLSTTAHKKSNISSGEARNHRPNRSTDMPMVVLFSAAFRDEYGEKYRKHVVLLSFLSCHSAL